MSFPAIAIPRQNVTSFFHSLRVRIHDLIVGQRFHPTQQDLLISTIDFYFSHALNQPSGDPIAIFYAIAKVWKAPLGDGAECLAGFCLLYVLSLDLFDDVQDEDLEGKPHFQAGPALAINNAITLLNLALLLLRNALELEKDIQKWTQYLSLFNRISLLAVNGQHRDLIGIEGANTPSQVLEMQQAKTSSLVLIAETAAIYAGCDEEIIQKYRDIVQAYVQLIQVVDDVRDILGKSISPDLLTGKITYPVICYLEKANLEEKQKFEDLIRNLPDALRNVRILLYDSGAIEKSAETIETFRQQVYEGIHSLDVFSPWHRLLLFQVDSLASSIYVLPALNLNYAVPNLSGNWHKRVLELSQDLNEKLNIYQAPSFPSLVSWHLPQYMYEPKRKLIFYPDLEGMPEEIVPFQAHLLGTDKWEDVLEIMYHQLPVVLAHEFFHYWRDESGNLTTDSWFEELAAHSLAMAYCKSFYPQAVQSSLFLAERVLAMHPEGISEKGKTILNALLIPERSPNNNTGYDIPMFEMALVQLAMLKHLDKENLTLSDAINKFLP